MLHHWFALWMQFVHDRGYLGVFLMMAVGSTVIPLPAEVVVPPAAYWAMRGSFSFWGVVLASTLGSWFGSAVSYVVARRLGRPLILRYGRFLLIPEKKWLLAESWINRYSVVGVFFGRLLPVVRHVVSLPAGAARMPFGPFTASTVLGSFALSWALARFGQEVLGSDPRLLSDPDALVHVLKAKLAWWVVAAVVMLVAYIGVDLAGRRWRKANGGG
ncbi:MAG TPA: DedA family protein [Dongiaceae bacterium]|nr:DedA family protein [Dongiaceae bacterium]